MPATNRLNNEDELNLIESYYTSKDEKLRDLLMQKFDYLPQILSRRFTGKGIEYDDIYQSARIGLLNALKRFEPKKGVRFTTYATPTIIGEIKRLFRDKGHFIKVPRRIYEIFSKANKIKTAHLLKSGETLTNAELAELTGVTEQQMNAALEWGDNHFVRSLEQYVCSDQDETLFSNFVGKDDNQFLLIENKEFIETFMSKLSEKERQFVRLRYYDELTQSAIAQKMNISQMNVSRMEKRVLSTLKQMYFEAVNS